MLVEPYLFFEGCCEEALNFYVQTLDAEITFMMYFKDSPEPESCPDGGEDKVMHANLRIGDTTIMASDGRCEGTPDFQGFALSLSPTTDEDARRIFNALLEGGEMLMPLEKTFWSPLFGMVKDRFGMIWMINMPDTTCL